MKKIIQYLYSKLKTDKQKHFIAGFIIALWMGAIYIPIGVIGFIVIGAAKEAYDYFSKKGNAEFMDFLYTFGGGTLGTAILVLIHLIFGWAII